MTRYPNEETARAAAAGLDILCLAEIEAADGERCIIGAKCGYDVLTRALKAQPHPEIKRIIRCVADLRGEQIAAQRAAAEASGEAEYDRLVANLERARDAVRYHGGGEDGTGGNYTRRSVAQSALAAYREARPDLAAKYDAQSMIADAEKEEQLAAGAATYSADGWLSAEDRAARAEEHRVKAAKLRALAAKTYPQSAV